MQIKNIAISLMLMGAIAVPGVASATAGYFSHGYGLKSKGMAGIGVTRTDDAFGGANNPATMVFAGDRLDLGVDIFSPKREASRTGSFPGFDGSVQSDSNVFAIPEIGYNKMVGTDMSVGVSMYGNGGMNTNYPGGQFTCQTPQGVASGLNMLCGQGRLGVDLMQLVIAPTLALKISPTSSFGISPLIGGQRFKAEGLQAFQQLSSAPDKVTNNGYDTKWGLGWRIGYYAKLGSMVDFGAAYSSKIKMGKFDKYSGLFADGGSFDMPVNYNLGLTVQPVQPLKVAFEYQRINYGDVASIANPSTNRAPLGAANGPGFGWKNVNVYKMGASYQAMPNLTLRAGYAIADNPVQSRDVTFNIIAPGVVQNHYTLGMTYGIGKNNEITVAYMHAAKNSVSGTSLFTGFGAPATTTETVSMYQNSLGLAWGYKF